MTAKVAILLKLAPNNSARFNSSGPTSRSLMQNSSSVYEQQHRLKFGENGEKTADREYRHHHKRKKSKKKRERSAERKKGGSSSRSGEKQNPLEDQLLYYSSGASNDMHSVGLPSDGGAGGVKFDLIQQEEDDDDEDGDQELLLDGPRHRKRKRDHSPGSINDGEDDNNCHVSKRSNNGDVPLRLFDTPPPPQSRLSRTEEEIAVSPGSDEEDDDFDLVSEEPYSYHFDSEVSNNVSVVITSNENHFQEEVEGVEVMSDDDDDDDDEDNDAVTATIPTAISTHLEFLELNNHVEDGPRSLDGSSDHHQYHEEDGNGVLDEAEIHLIHNLRDNEFKHVIQEVDEDEVAGEEVTSLSHIDVESLHTDRIPNVNGNFDSSGEFHQWHQSYAVESYSGEPLHILPYAVIDF